ncbi:MAG: hydrogenase nickel incorporation protein HypB [Bacilli bacterium]|nr:hydrogenase nickel incorporation protein HypB [Bacilli bacterium]
MSELKVIKVKQSVLANNDLRAAKLRGELKEKGVFFLNVMSSPGSGKTTLLIELINRLKKFIRIGVIEADMDAVVDANTVEKATGVRTIQLNTSGECHLDAKMTSEGIEALGAEGLDFIILENIGNLVCPAEFDTGANANMVLLSVPEGDDKPLKYPLMFTRGDFFVFTKMDATVVFDFDLEKVEERIRRLNPNAVFFPVSAKKGDGIEALCDFLLKQVRGE